jgi:hypothetical protein
VAPGFLLAEGGGVLNLVGDAEYFVNNNASWRFDGSYFLAALNDNTPLKMNHGVYVGMCFRPTLRDFAPFVGFQPGLHLTQMSSTSGTSEPLRFAPVISGIAGFNWYLISFMHITAGMRVLHGATFNGGAGDDITFALTEMRGWLGLGFQVSTTKRKFEDY